VYFAENDRIISSYFTGYRGNSLPKSEYTFRYHHVYLPVDNFHFLEIYYLHLASLQLKLSTFRRLYILLTGHIYFVLFIFTLLQSVLLVSMCR
jgi:hypothetical protein